MLVRWCLKGIAERDAANIPRTFLPSRGFRDVEALEVLARGLPSQWMLANNVAMIDNLRGAQAALSDQALDYHVNNYKAVRHSTPYISLSSGIVLPSASGGVTTHPTWKTALDFATRGGRTSGYVFRCWVLVVPKANARLLAVANEVRNLNVFRQFWIFHYEGEIAAPLHLPVRQFAWVRKYDSNLSPMAIQPNGTARVENPDHVRPEDVANLMEAIA